MVSPVLQAASQYYDLPLMRLTPLGAEENSVYSFRADGNEYILRLTDSTRSSLDLIQAELDWIRDLDRHGVNVATPVALPGHRCIESVAVGPHDYYAVVFRRAPGLVGSQIWWTADVIREWGKTLGQLHSVSETYRPAVDAPRRLHWTAQHRFDVERYLPADQSVVRLRWRSLAAALSRDLTPYGLIHADLNADNFCVEHSGLTVFDFDDSMYCSYLYDIAAVLYSLRDRSQRSSSPVDYLRRFIDHFMAGYLSLHPFPSTWIDQLPGFLKVQELEQYISLHRRGIAHSTAFSFAQRLRASIESDALCMPDAVWYIAHLNI